MSATNNRDNLGESFSSAADYEGDLTGATVRLTDDPLMRSAFESASAWTGIDASGNLTVVDSYDHGDTRFLTVQDADGNTADDVAFKFDVVREPAPAFA